MRSAAVAISLMLAGCAEPAAVPDEARHLRAPPHHAAAPTSAQKGIDARLGEMRRDLDEAEKVLRIRPAPYRLTPPVSGQ